ncbi:MULTISPECIES: hypothetical protein [Streptomyces]|uniref:hypothetical protein n=1 Tax=Streptomyces TaxID=1883 RepID=UPI00058EC805|nr:hypothetical protein [Streptomyces sp. SCSIO ZS0520]AYN35251.1 hypothetical protein DUI70_4753 [Streptomyces albus]
MVRRPVALVGAVVLVGEAIGIGLLNWFLGLVVDRQDMSMGGLDPDAMSIGTWIGGGVFGLYLLLCALVMLLVGIRNRPAVGIGRILLISAAVVHALLGAFTVGLVGWLAFVFMMVVFGLIVLTLVADARTADAVDKGEGPAESGTGTEGGAPQPA